jgi:hypothetical protein
MPKRKRMVTVMGIAIARNTLTALGVNALLSAWVAGSVVVVVKECGVISVWVRAVGSTFGGGYGAKGNGITWSYWLLSIVAGHVIVGVRVLGENASHHLQ